jgi:ATP-dependent Clp protease ATP-binding subunit ClpA
MFERFTKTARKVVTDALVAADDAGDDLVRPRHLAHALVADRGSRAARALDQLGVTVETVADAADAVDRRGGLSAVDVDALAGIGIDVDEVIDTVERNWGAQALAPRSPRRRRWMETRLSDTAKSAVEQSLRQAIELGDRQIDDSHLLLGLLRVDDPLVHELAARGVTYLEVRTLLTARTPS